MKVISPWFMIIRQIICIRLSVKCFSKTQERNDSILPVYCGVCVFPLFLCFLVLKVELNYHQDGAIKWLQ